MIFSWRFRNWNFIGLSIVFDSAHFKRKFSTRFLTDNIFTICFMNYMWKSHIIDFHHWSSDHTNESFTGSRKFYVLKLSVSILIVLRNNENDQNRHQHLKVVANTFGLQHPSPTLMSLTKHLKLVNNIVAFKDVFQSNTYLG